MTDAEERIDPTDVRGIEKRAREWAGPDERILAIGIDAITIQEDALPGLTEVVRRYAGGGPVLMVVDHTVMHRGGDDLKAAVRSALGRAGPVTVRRLPDDANEPFHADLETARQLAAELPVHAGVVSVGSGNVTDVVKYARHLAGHGGGPHLPFISFPTAASVTAYTSALAVLTVHGVKRTLPARPPEAVVCDLQALAQAPLPMTQAGFGDVMARSVAYGDWYLANQLGMDDGFSEVPGRLLDHAEQAMIDVAEDVAVAGPMGVRAVVEAVLLAGVAMSLVNQTAPVSGWEHVISHYLDLRAGCGSREPALHGAQVGVGTVIAARAYERAWPMLDVDRLMRDEDTDGHVSPRGLRLARGDAVSGWASDRTLRDEILRDYTKKLARWAESSAARRTFAAAKQRGDFDNFLGRNVRPSHDVESALRRAGAPTCFDELHPKAPPTDCLEAVLNAHTIRARFTLGDLLDFAGWLRPESARALMA